MKRPERKDISAKVSEEDMIYFSLGIDNSEFILPSQRKDYRSDMRAVQLVNAVQNGKKMKNMDFSGINLKGADISGGIFEGCQFKEALFYKTQADTCDFSECVFDGSYLEESDFTGCDFTHASFKRVFAKNNRFEKAFLEEDSLKYLTNLEKIIRLIEKGELDIRTLAKEDLLHLDIRRLDFSKVDLEDLDLSMFALDGINLCGTYIDPKQLMSLEGWNSYCLNLQRINEFMRERLCRKVLFEKEEAIKKYAQLQKEQSHNFEVKTSDKNIHKPSKKESEKDENHAWGIEKARKSFVAQKEAELKEKKELAPEEILLFEKYRNKYTSSEEKETRQQAVHQRFSNTKDSKQPENTIGIPVTDQHVKALSDELKIEPAFSIVSKSLDQETSPTTETQISPKTKAASSENEVNNYNNIKEQQIDNKEKKINPVLIVSHKEEESSFPSQAEQTIPQKEAFSPISSERNVAEKSDSDQEQTLRQKEPNKTTYPYFQEKEEETAETEITAPVKKETDDEEETIHTLQQAGYSLEEIAQILREKGPLKVIGKQVKTKKVKYKTKG